jgi:hypothetical protein
MGQSYGGKHLREPINIILVDEVSANAMQASTAALAASAAAGYPVRLGHSTGYKAFVGDRLYTRFPRGWDDALSDAPFKLSNNHGRLFGPYETSRGYVLVGAFSREEVDLLRWPAIATRPSARRGTISPSGSIVSRRTAEQGSSTWTMRSALILWCRPVITTARPSC